MGDGEGRRAAVDCCERQAADGNGRWATCTLKMQAPRISCPEYRHHHSCNAQTLGMFSVVEDASGDNPYDWTRAVSASTPRALERSSSAFENGRKGLQEGARTPRLHGVASRTDEAAHSKCVWPPSED